MAKRVPVLYLKRYPWTDGLAVALTLACVLDLTLYVVFLYLAAMPDPWVLEAAMVSFNTFAVPLAFFGLHRESTSYLWNLVIGKFLSTGAVCAYLVQAAASARLSLLKILQSEAGPDVMAVLSILLIVYILELVAMIAVLVKSDHQESMVWEHLAAAAQSRVDSETDPELLSASSVFFDQLHSTFSMLEHKSPWADIKRQIMSAARGIERATRGDFVQRLVGLVAGRQHFLVLCTFILSLSIATFTIEIAKVLSQQGALFDARSVSAMRTLSYGYRDAANNQLRIPEGTRLHNDTRVLIVVMDGLRFDHVHGIQFWNSDTYAATCTPATCVDKQDVALFRSVGQLPSMSVPNWLTILTGAPPESTGVLGNMLVPDTVFESIFSVARDGGVMRMVTGTPWFAGIISSTLPFLRGDGTIAANYLADETTVPSSRQADIARTRVGVQALHTKEDPYGLMLVHFSDIDSQGHYAGVTKQWNKNDTYNYAIADKSAALRTLLESTDDNTVVFVCADHGHVDAGGHGGVDNVLRDVPLMVYKRKSKLADLSSEAIPGFGNLDIAPTAAALLGLPVPGQSLGRFVTPIISKLVPSKHIARHYQDLYAQKYALLSHFKSTWANDVAATLPSLNACSKSINETAGHRDCNTDVSRLIDLYFNVLRPAAIDGTNWVFALCVFFLINAGSLLLMQYTTPADPMGVISIAIDKLGMICTRRRIRTRIIATQRSTRKLQEAAAAAAATNAANIAPQPSHSAAVAPALVSKRSSGWLLPTDNVTPRYSKDSPKLNIERTNIRAFLYAVAGVCLYYALSIIAFVIGFKVRGYEVWDSTMIHSPNAFTITLLIIFLPTTGIAFVLLRIHSLMNQKVPDGLSVQHHIRRIFVDTHVRYRDPLHVYLVNLYLMMVAVFASLLLHLLASVVMFPVPGVLQVPFITSTSWAFRFRIITMFGLNIPLLVVAMFKTWHWDWEAVHVSQLELFVQALGIYVAQDFLSDMRQERILLPAPVARIASLSSLDTSAMDIRPQASHHGPTTVLASHSVRQPPHRRDPPPMKIQEEVETDIEQFNA